MTGNIFFKYVGQVMYMRMTLIYQNYIHAEMKSNLNAGRLCIIQFKILSLLLYSKECKH